MITIDAICRYCGASFKARVHDVKRGHGTSCSRECYYKSKKVEPIDKRLWSKVNISDENDCWEYKERLNEHGYGVFHIKYKSVLAHRVAYQITKGEIPDGMVVMHSCDRPSCCNPNHLNLGTQQDNIADMYKKKRAVVTKGECHHKAKLTEKDVLDIRRQYGKKDKYQLAHEYGVNANNISFIVNNKTWKHLL